jgi:diguanylate cyclase (GGDEF)-like protein
MMRASVRFYRSLVDSITEHIVVIDARGRILFVNKSWINFGVANGCPSSFSWLGKNYMETCNRSTAEGDSFGKLAADGIGTVIARRSNIFYMEYPCHSSTEKRWFMMRVTPLELQHESLFVISHQNITERKLAEEEVLNLSRIDGLTGIANRRFFDEFLQSEWRRCGRLGLPISLLMLDIDHFKLFNDTYGHLAGDGCLKRIGESLRMFGKRPGDLVARYGGEEFVLVLSNTGLTEAVGIAEELLEMIRRQNIVFITATLTERVTVSIGVACMAPQKDIDGTHLVQSADTMLYKAKENGRNRVAFLS